MNLHSIPPGVPFLDTLARWWLDQAAGADPLAVADGMILLPTRRAARALTEAFLRASSGRPLLLPRIVALGGIDEAPLALAGALALKPAILPMQRLSVLTRMVLAMEGAYGAPDTADRAWLLAAELAALLDEAHRAEVDLAAVLPEAAGAGYAEHWAHTIEFLQIVTRAWPQYLDGNGLMDQAARGVALLDAQAEAWRQDPPGIKVVLAGTTGGIPAVARLARVVAGLKQGRVILPGVDLSMPEELWAALPDGHPQAGLRHLLIRLNATRADVRAWDTAAPPRAALLGQALLPAAALGSWREGGTPEIGGIERLEPADQQEEAVSVALVLREALETPGAHVALITPDRQLAQRTAAELGRYDIVVDDSAGEALADSPPAALLRLLAVGTAERLPPVALLSILKHPLCGLGLAPSACRQAARTLELACLRGPAPPPGIEGLRQALAGKPDIVPDRLDRALAPLAAEPATLADALRALIETAEAVAATDDAPGAARLWAHEEGEALATHLAALLEALPILPFQGPAILPGLLDATLQGVAVRSRRALRGRQGAEHPRVQILGLLEARLQHFDVAVLGGLAEGVWPPATDPGPWMSRPMREKAGLDSPEVQVGQMAHDFTMAACAAPRVVLSCPRRREGAPAVPARWLVRLSAMLRGQQAVLPLHPAASWARKLDQPDGAPRPALPPQPRPPAAVRPRRLSVTAIETWLRDPYAIYARHILGLRALDPLEQQADAADYGQIVHAAIAAFLAGLPPTFPLDAAARLRADMDRALDAAGLRPALAAWWRPRLARIADWLAETERARRLVQPRPLVKAEISGEWTLDTAGGPFLLTGRADRIERLVDGRLAILDYKTGLLPRQSDVEAGLAPQLLLEAAMAEQGAFGADIAAAPGELAYWRLTGGHTPGEIKQVAKADPAADARAAAGKLLALIRDFDDPGRAYLSQPHPGAAPRFSDYAQLARCAEWAALEDEA